MKYFLSFFILIIFSFYFILTIFINVPEDSVIVGENLKSYQFLQNILYQKWTFFAPPPLSNKRTVYEFISKKEDGSAEIFTIELFEKIAKKLQKEYLFNDITANSDWILFNYVETLANQSKTAYKIFKAGKNCENDECYSNFFRSYHEVLQSTKQMKFLVNHGTIIAKKMNMPLNSEFRIKVYDEEIPKYNDRNNLKLKRKRTLTFSTELYNLSSKTWKN
jgi:hypothetical protein